MTEEVLLVTALLGVLAGALAQAATGMGFSLVAAPVLVLVLGPREGVVATLGLATLASLVPLAREARQVQPGAVLRLLVPTLLCTPVVVWALRGADTRWLAAAGGVGVVVAVALLAGGLRSAWFRTAPAVVLTGAASAVLNVVGGVGGPPVGLYAANAGWEPRALRANLHAFFVVQNAVTALALGVRVPSVLHLVALLLGTVAGTWLCGRMSPATVRAGVLVVSLVGGLGLLGGAVAS